LLSKLALGAIFYLRARERVQPVGDSRILSPMPANISKREEQRLNTMNEAPPVSTIPDQPKNCGLAVWSLVLSILAGREKR
jgi:hypothetical protein